MPKPGGCHPSGISLGDVLRLPKRHPAWRRREAQSGSRKKLTCSGHATNSRRHRDLGSTCLCRGSFHSLRVGNAGGRLVWNVRTWSAMLREKAQVAQTARPKVLMRRRGADCSVLVMKRGNARGAKGAGHRHWRGSTGNGRNPMINGRRQPSSGGTSRMMREYQVRIWCSEAS